MTPQELETRLRAMIVDRLFLPVAPEEIPVDASLVEDYGVDSVNLLELVVGLEEEFGLALDGGDFNAAHFGSVAALRDFVRTRLGG